MVVTYSKKSHGSLRIAPNFRVEEFASPDTDVVKIDTKLIDVLQAIRNHFGKSVNINSGYRSPSHDKKVGGSGSGRHTKGLAADIVINGVSPIAVGLYALELLGSTGGIEIGNSYCHIDVDNRRWRAFTEYGGSQYETVSDFGSHLKKKT